MNTPDLRILERRLIESRLTLEQQAHPPDETARDHPGAAAAWNLEKLWRRLAVLQTREIDVALLKIHRGEFGICEGCGQPISSQRLDAIPWARQCFPCHSGQAQKTFALFQGASWRRVAS
ncbi:MAG TPA: TraR/DksA C4-type zinc finger protein [Bryobacterales bacterium]|nr:TraR/DksA C4-type zinc finger protein [Bryobacterales bacterium]